VERTSQESRMITANNTADTTARGVMRRLNIEDKTSIVQRRRICERGCHQPSSRTASHNAQDIKILAGHRRSNTSHGRTAAAHAENLIDLRRGGGSSPREGRGCS
jgi:hypothetical protein